jgi:hypothetical protein
MAGNVGGMGGRGPGIDEWLGQRRGGGKISVGKSVEQGLVQFSRCRAAAVAIERNEYSHAIVKE